MQGAHLLTVCFAVDVVKGEERALLARLHVNEACLFHVLIHQLVAPPCGVEPLGNELAIVFAPEVEVFECKLL